jgi:Killing trait
MAFPTSVNDQITDSVTQANVQVLGSAPSVALGNLYQATSLALATAAHNATMAQQQMYITAQAATTAGVALIYGSVAAARGVATEDILGV